MGSLFGKPEKTGARGGGGGGGSSNPQSKGTVTSKDRAVLDLKNARDRLKKYRKKLEKDSDQLTEKAKQLIREQKRERALLVLKLKKHKEKEVSNIDGQLISVLEMIDNIEWESANLEVMKALQVGNAALNKLHEEISVEDVENLLAETNEAIETENQINLLLAGQFNAVDDEELQAELAALMGEEVPSKPATQAATPATTPQQPALDLPEAPQGQVAVLPPVPVHAVQPAQPVTEEEQAELAAL